MMKVGLGIGPGYALQLANDLADHYG